MSETRTVSPTLEERLAAALCSQEVVGLLTLVPHDLQEGVTLAPGFALDVARAILAAAKEHGLVIGEGKLDAAWKEAEEALPEGWVLRLYSDDEEPRYRACAGDRKASEIEDTCSTWGSNAALALKELAAKLRDSRR